MPSRLTPLRSSRFSVSSIVRHSTIIAIAALTIAQTRPVDTALVALTQHWAQLKDVHTLEARFICEKDLAALETPLHSEGRLWIRKPGPGPDDTDGVRFSTEKPYVSELILTAGKVFARSQHEDDWTKTNQSQRPGLTAVMGQLGGWSTGDAQKIGEMYSITHDDAAIPAPPGSLDTSPAPTDVFILTPTNADLAKVLKHVTLAVDTKTSLVRFLEIQTRQEDVTRYWFLDVKTNAPLPADIFKPGALVVDEGK